MDILTTPTPLESLVAELVATGGWFERVIVHMRRSAARAGHDDGDIADILGELLCGTLEHWAADRGAAELAAATEVLRSASELCAREILLVREAHDRRAPAAAGPRARGAEMAHAPGRPAVAVSAPGTVFGRGRSDNPVPMMADRSTLTWPALKF